MAKAEQRDVPDGAGAGFARGEPLRTLWAALGRARGSLSCSLLPPLPFLKSGGSGGCSVALTLSFHVPLGEGLAVASAQRTGGTSALAAVSAAEHDSGVAVLPRDVLELSL